VIGADGPGTDAERAVDYAHGDDGGRRIKLSV
jgi:hypothetical protein